MWGGSAELAAHYRMLRALLARRQPAPRTHLVQLAVRTQATTKAKGLGGVTGSALLFAIRQEAVPHLPC